MGLLTQKIGGNDPKRHNFPVISICWMCFYGSRLTAHGARENMKNNLQGIMKKEGMNCELMLF
jgi:hypothetical protein